MSGRLLRVRRAAALLRPYRQRVAGAMVAIMATTAASLAPPYLAGRAVDDVIKAGSTEQLDEIVAIMIVAVSLGWFAGYIQTYRVGWVGQHALRDLRTRLFEHLQRLSVSFYDRNSAGKLISRMTNNIEDLDQLVTDGVQALVSSAVTFLAAFGVLFILDPELALVAVISIPPLIAGTIAYNSRSAAAFRDALNTVAGVTDYMEESLAGGRVVRAYAQEGRHRREFAAVNGRNREASWRPIWLNTLYMPYVAVISIVSIALVILVGGLQVIDGTQELGVVVAFIGYLQLALGTLPSVASLYTIYQQGTAALDQTFELLETQPEILDKPGAPDLPPLKGEVEFDRVGFAYAGDRSVLTGISLHVEPGETLAIVGATGAGKSTLIKLVPRFYDPTEGRVLVDGQDLRGVTAASLRRQIGLVPQEPMLFSGSIRSNIAFARSDASDAEVAEAARSVGVLDLLEALPGGLDTAVGERGDALSAGERQLVALARAALPDPRIVILDEATASVDAATEGRIRVALEHLLAGRTALIVAHRLSTVRDADRVAVLDRGRIVELGTHDELLRAGGTYSQLCEEWGEVA